MVVKDFNPRSDERSDYELVHVDVVQRISIHAPTNGATKNIRSVFQVSSHFNPRSDERSDHEIIKLPAEFVISIHAPTNGATGGGGTTSALHSHFNPRSDERSDVNACTRRLRVSLFQSTLRRTERLCEIVITANTVVFQSTLRRTERLVCE